LIAEKDYNLETYAGPENSIHLGAPITRSYTSTFQYTFVEWWLCAGAS